MRIDGVLATHSHAGVAKVTLKQEGGEVVLEVSDNGRGISKEEMYSSKSLGLIGMRERVRLLGGELAISGVPGKGTTATVRVPLGAKEEEEGK